MPCVISSLNVQTGPSNSLLIIEHGKSDGIKLQELGCKGLELPSCLHSFLTHLINEMMLRVSCSLEGPQDKTSGEVIPANNHIS